MIKGARHTATFYSRPTSQGSDGQPSGSRVAALSNIPCRLIDGQAREAQLARQEDATLTHVIEVIGYNRATIKPEWDLVIGGNDYGILGVTQPNYGVPRVLISAVERLPIA